MDATGTAVAPQRNRRGIVAGFLLLLPAAINAFFALLGTLGVLG